MLPRSKHEQEYDAAQEQKEGGWGYGKKKMTSREDYTGPSNRQIGEKVADLERQIDWLKSRLLTLVLDEEDRAQTVDYICELEEELHSLLWSFGWPASGGVRRGADAL